MDSFEKYIKERQGDFHNKSLPKGHEARFLQKLDESKKVRRTSLLLKISGIAAVLAFAVIGGSILHWGTPDESVFAKKQLPKELQEAESYYLAKCEEQMNYFQVHYSSNSPIDIAEKLEVLEKEYKELKDKMVEQPGNKRITAALVQNLQLRLQLLEQINRLMEKEEPQTVDV